MRHAHRKTRLIPRKHTEVAVELSLGRACEIESAEGAGVGRTQVEEVSAADGKGAQVAALGERNGGDRTLHVWGAVDTTCPRVTI